MADRYECSVASVERGEPLFATGSVVRGWLAIEVLGAYGHDVVRDTALAHHVAPRFRDRMRALGLRVLAIRQRSRPNDLPTRLYACTVRRPGAGRPVLWQRDITGLDALEGVLDEFDADLLHANRSPGPGWTAAPEPVFLVCTNGRHDQCCANQGRPLIRALAASRHAERVWESSHVGGDRFAPNLVVLPDSLYFGRVDPDTAVGLIDGIIEGRVDRRYFRGRTAYTWPEQAAEHFVRSHLGIDGADGVIVEPGDRRDHFVVTAAGRRLRVRIRRGMSIPPSPITCSGRPGQSVPTFDLVSIDDV